MERTEHNIYTGESKMVALTQAEAAEVNTPSKEKTNLPILSQIAALEAQVDERVWREYVIKPTVAGKGGKTPAQFIADIDAQIATLRSTLIA